MPQRVAAVIALVAMSHWVLDLIVHRPDLLMLPGNMGDLPRLGFGHWEQPRLAALLELVLVAAGALVYWRAANKVSVAAGRSGARAAALCAGLIAAFGVLVLFLDYSS